MRQLFSTHKIYIILALGVVVALVAWWSLSGETPSNSVLTSTSPTDSEGIPVDENLVDTLLQLRAVSLSGTIFSDPSFMILRDFGTQIVPEPVGRPNPFAPLSTRSTNTAGTSTKLFAPKRP